MMRGGTGFTLIEVIVVIALIAILTSLATLSLGDYLPSLRLKRATQELQLQIQKARLEAVRRSRNCHVEFHKVIGATRYAPIIWIDENGNDTFDVGEEVFRQEVDGATLELGGYGGIRFNTDKGGGDGVDFTDNAFRFDSRGLCRPDGGSVHLLNGKGRGKSIMVTLGGAVRINKDESP